MHPLTQTFAADHIGDLLRESESERLASLARGSRTGSTAAWRRSLGAGADRLSVALAGFAVRLDPSVPQVRDGLRRYGAE
jgi:hypothetical protein